MTIEEIRKNAPEGATHYDDIHYWKLKDNFWYVWLNNKWGCVFFEFEKLCEPLRVKPLY